MMIYGVAPPLNVGTSGALIWCCGVSNLRSEKGSFRGVALLTRLLKGRESA